jgi:membrane protease subunit HflK
VRSTSPGPHAKLPFGIERVQKVPVERQLKQEFGFRTVVADIESHFRKDEKTAAESLMLTGDLNVATVEWIVQYKISDPYKYLFKLRDVEQTFRLMAEASMRTVVGDHSVTELLTVGREAIAARAKELLSELCRFTTTASPCNNWSFRTSTRRWSNRVQRRQQAIRDATRHQQRGRSSQEIPRARESRAKIRRRRATPATGEPGQGYPAVHHFGRNTARRPGDARIYRETLSAVLPGVGRR